MHFYCSDGNNWSLSDVVNEVQSFIKNYCHCVPTGFPSLCYVVASNFVTLISVMHGPCHRIIELQIGKVLKIIKPKCKHYSAKFGTGPNFNFICPVTLPGEEHLLEHFSQNHGISGVGMDPQGSLIPTPDPAQNSPKSHTTCPRTLSKCFLSSARLVL